MTLKTECVNRILILNDYTPALVIRDRFDWYKLLFLPWNTFRNLKCKLLYLQLFEMQQNQFMMSLCHFPIIFYFELMEMS